jgi:hypothetical protein
MMGEPEAREPCLKIGKEPLCLVPMFEADDSVIRIAHNNHVARGTSLAVTLYALAPPSNTSGSLVMFAAAKLYAW